MHEPRILVFSTDTSCDDPADFLAGGGYQVETASTSADALRVLSAAKVDLCLLDMAARSIDSYLVYKALRSASPEERPPVLLLIDENQDYSQKQIEDSGKTTVLRKPYLAEQLLSEVAALLPNGLVREEGEAGDASGTGHAERETTTGRIVALYGAKGGIGKTFLSVNLAAALTKLQGNSVVLVDGDLQFGEVAARLRLSADRSLYNLASHGRDLAWPALRGIIRGHRSGLHTIPAPPQPWLAEHISGDLLAGMLSVLRRQYRYIVVDTRTAYDENTLVILDQTDDILLIATQDEATRRNAISFLAVAKRLGYDKKVWVVINKYDPQQTPVVGRLEKDLRRRLIATIAADPEGAAARERAGDPLIGQNGAYAAARDLLALADSVQRLATVRHR
jgi:pilus assembly protein CpaE